LIEPSVKALGFRLVQVRMMGGEQRKTLQIMAEPSDLEREMDVDDCAEVSRAVSAILDVEDPIAGAYVLEVSSPGLDRPLVTEEDYIRFAGHEARIELRRQIDGRRHYTGILQGAKEGVADIVVNGANDGEVVHVPLNEVERAKLRLTDGLVEAALKKRKH
jgi:ribosome maturation factor RimP